MSAYVCFCIAAVIIIAATVLLFCKKAGKNRFVFVTLLLFLCAYAAYFPVHLSVYDMFTAVLSGIINLFHIISFESSFLDYYDTVTEFSDNLVFVRLYLAVLAFIHMAIPAMSAMTAFSLLMTWIEKLRMGFFSKRKKTVYIFSEINYSTKTLAQSIRKTDTKSNIVFFSELDSDDTAELRKMLSCSVYSGEIQNFSINSAKRKVYIYLMSDNSDENLNKYLDIMDILIKKEPEQQQNISIYVSCRDTSAELLIDSVEKGLIDVNLINEQRSAVYNLFDRYPLSDYCRDSVLSVLICGFSHTAQEALRAAAWCGQLAGCKLRISVATENADKKRNIFFGMYPGLASSRYDISFYEMTNMTQLRNVIREKCSDASYIIAAHEDDVFSLECAVALRREYYKVTDSFDNCPPVFVYVTDREKARAVSLMRTAETREDRRFSYNITPFGMSDEIYGFESIADSHLSGLAKNIHLVYEDIFSENGVDVNKALRTFNAFEVNKSASISNALHIRYKLNMLGLDYVRDDADDEVDFAAELTNDKLEMLSQAEHDRWMAFLESEGWESATVSDVNAYKNSGISSGKHSCQLLKLHPYICDYPDLQEISKSLGLPDAVKYDRELIRRIPDILHDKWGVSGKKYKIKKINKGE